MPVGHENHGGVPVAPTVSRCGFHQPLDFRLGQVLAGSQLAVGKALGPDCSIYGGWRDKFEVRLGHDLRTSF